MKELINFRPDLSQCSQIHAQKKASSFLRIFSLPLTGQKFRYGTTFGHSTRNAKREPSKKSNRTT